MIFEIKSGVFVSSDEIRGIIYKQSPIEAMKDLEKSWIVIVDIKGCLGFCDSYFTKEEARELCLEYVKKWNDAKREDYL